MNHALRIITTSPSETEGLGLKLGRFLKAGGGATVCLYGDLGAGKTTLIKGIASAFGIPERDIGSASFVIVAEYETTPPFYHIDLYRVEREDDIDNLGIWEYIGSGGIAVVEWAERLSELPEDAIKGRMNYVDENSREIIIEGINEKDWHNM
ncbi:tRNA (adenosine(37)-N6)-threonylcarbamoyltransferase complex ATPase subunit type 1 TsaE [Dissulfurispira sp.]|uniref:tRNA (adenosine(37)-N6)-threonylcarbamoyltransferase complex ATPase subunit type 1 TsaE n=1 Tax=Dissulfurispira sp. TaxID=2817609 RepID=UPI002FD92AF8